MIHLRSNFFGTIVYFGVGVIAPLSWICLWSYYLIFNPYKTFAPKMLIISMILFGISLPIYFFAANKLDKKKETRWKKISNSFVALGVVAYLIKVIIEIFIEDY